MLSYIVRRIGSMIPSLLLASVIVFLFIHLIPGDPAQIMLGDQATPEQVRELRETMGLDRPLVVQYGKWLSGVVRGDFGNSVFFHQPVLHVILDGRRQASLLRFPC